MNNNPSLYDKERLLVYQAQYAIEKTIRDWYPAYRVHGMRMTLTGNIVAKLVAWQAVANSIASQLDNLGAPVDAGLVEHAYVIQAARHVVSRGAQELWPGATYTPRWGSEPMAFSVEFETYRYGAIALANQLGMLCAQCMALHTPPAPPSRPGPSGYGQSNGPRFNTQAPLTGPEPQNQQ